LFFIQNYLADRDPYSWLAPTIMNVTQHLEGRQLITSKDKPGNAFVYITNMYIYNDFFFFWDSVLVLKSLLPMVFDSNDRRRRSALGIVK
jgi:hypothetical protein